MLQLGGRTMLTLLAVRPSTSFSIGGQERRVVPVGPYKYLKEILPFTISDRCAEMSKSVVKLDTKKFVPPYAQPPGPISDTGAMVGTPPTGVTSCENEPFIVWITMRPPEKATVV